MAKSAEDVAVGCSGDEVALYLGCPTKVGGAKRVVSLVQDGSQACASKESPYFSILT